MLVLSRFEVKWDGSHACVKQKLVLSEFVLTGFDCISSFGKVLLSCVAKFVGVLTVECNLGVCAVFFTPLFMQPLALYTV